MDTSVRAAIRCIGHNGFRSNGLSSVESFRHGRFSHQMPLCQCKPLIKAVLKGPFAIVGLTNVSRQRACPALF